LFVAKADDYKGFEKQFDAAAGKDNKLSKDEFRKLEDDEVLDS